MTTVTTLILARIHATRFVSLSAIALLVATLQSAPVRAGPMAVAGPRPASAELMQLERDIGAANIRRDKAFFERVEADEFLFTGSDGSVTTKAEDVASLDHPSASTLERYDLDSMKVMTYGDAAVVWGVVTESGHRKDGTAFSSRTRFTDVFVRRDRRWQLVAGHSSRLPSAPH